MSNTKKAVATYAHVTPALMARVKEVISESEKHKYSVSMVYGTYNAALKKNDPPQTCSSCLRKRVEELKTWYAAYAKSANVANPVLTTKEVAKVAKPVNVITDYEALTTKLNIVFVNTPESEYDALHEFVNNPENNALINEQEEVLIQTRYDALGLQLKLITQEELDKRDNPILLKVVLISMADKTTLEFTPNEGEALKGKVTNLDKSAIKPGKYPTADGRIISVQPGGKATIKEEDLT